MSTLVRPKKHREEASEPVAGGQIHLCTYKNPEKLYNNKRTKSPFRPRPRPHPHQRQRIKSQPASQPVVPSL